MQHIGVDLAWSEGNDRKPANESGLVVLDEQGAVQDAGWARGLDEVVAWLERVAVPGAVIAIDAPLVITNATGNRQCESEVARCYGRWQVYANSSNSAMGWQAGVVLRERLEALGFVYLDGTRAADPADRSFFECYPYTTLVGMWELGYDDERPRYKRLVPGLPAAEARASRAQACDELLRRVAALPAAEDPLDLRSHPVTAVLLDEPSPVEQVPYKHREDLLDAAICAWTAAIWQRHGDRRTQVLGATAEPDAEGRRPTIVAPARPEQRLAARTARGSGAAGTAERGARVGAAPSVGAALEAVQELRRLTATLSARLETLEKDLRRLRRDGS
jgi:predicted RNase H-like nuclease